ncbi:MAG: S-methyl-5-thioribose-1-phosphate isomerase [Bacteroidetes bacterium]|nr:S-methyl-5-thioribose-1-phosphate isomerase [Bacteroidota bacterium]
MRVGGKHYRTVWMEDHVVYFIEQNLLPFEFRIQQSLHYRQTCEALRTMQVRGAGAIGALSGFAMAQAFLEAKEHNDSSLIEKARVEIESTRPTARNLFYAVEKVHSAGLVSSAMAVGEAQSVANKDAEDCRKIGEYGNSLIRDGFRIETHCNAGWLAFVDYGTALSPLYLAHSEGKDIFVFVDETRPRSQGARLTAWELHEEGIPHTIIADNAGAWLMAGGKVDMMITGADRIAANGDTANKIGTFEKALAARALGIPFYIAAPLSTFDLNCKTGKDIPIEERSQEEVLYAEGPDENGDMRKIRLASPGSGAFNPAFDVTPAGLISGIITEKGIISATRDGVMSVTREP